ncbi:uncharacterized protein [Amphiura filiformis]|uniref:uncharacterized protein n=1 Tax=Amphiura filiformis TaxID=82378 RepID=UPI003B21706D
MICGGDTNQQVKVNGELVEQVATFNFLGSIIDNAGGSSQEIRRRLVMVRSSAIALTDIWKDRGISKATKIHIMDALVFPIALYGCETWAVGMTDKKKILALEMWCWRKMLRMSWKEHKTNEFVRNQFGEHASYAKK